MEGPDVHTGLGETEVRNAFTDVVTILRASPLTPRFGVESYNVCSGGEPDTIQPANFSFTMRARFDRASEAGSTRADANDLAACLVAAGWTPRDDNWAPDGVHEGSSRWTLYLAHGLVSLRIDMHGDSPIVLVAVTGSCMQPDDAVARWIADQSSVDVDVPGMVPLGRT
jgi:hypothetical protein